MKLFFIWGLVALFLPSAIFVEFSWHDSGELGREKRGKTEDDPLYSSSWHLHSVADIATDPFAKIDAHANVEGAWGLGFYGQGTRIGTGFLAPNPDHEDLKGHFTPQIPLEGTSDIATAALGTIVATANNNVCTRGVAYKATYSVVGLGYDFAVDLRFLGLDTPDVFLQPFTAKDEVHTPCARCWDSVKNATDHGVVVVSYSGNGGSRDNCNYDMYSNHPFSISVGSHMLGGFPSDSGEFCANALVSAAGGSELVGIPVPNGKGPTCAVRSGGQYAAAIVAGVVALMKQASPRKMTPREIAHILVATSNFSEEYAGVGLLQRNGAGLLFDKQLGFGMVDATAAVQMTASDSLSYHLLPNEVKSVRTSISEVIPDPGELTVPLVVEIEDSGTHKVLVDWVTLDVDIAHDRVSDLEISLISPSGTRSQLAAVRSQHGDSFNLVFKLSTGGKPMFQIVPLTQAGDEWKGGKVRLFATSRTGICCQDICSFTLDEKTPGVTAVLLLEKQGSCTQKEEIFEILNSKGQHIVPDAVIFEDHNVYEPYMRGIPTFSVSSRDFQYLWGLQGTVENTEVVKGVSKIPDLSFENWKFSTTNHWRERAKGTWMLEIDDLVPGDSGSLRSAKLNLHTYLEDSPPSPSPSPFPSPTPTPTPIRSYFHCCMYSFVEDASIQQCIPLNQIGCPTLPYWELGSESEQFEEDCEALCAPPSPSPSPTPSPSPVALKNCCVYAHVSASSLKQCRPSSFDTCQEFTSWVLDYKTLIPETTCLEICTATPTPPPTPTPTPVSPTPVKNCCVYSYEKNSEVKQCRPKSYGDCPPSKGWNFEFNSYVTEQDCVGLCEATLATPTPPPTPTPTPTPLAAEPPKNCCVYFYESNSAVNQCRPTNSVVCQDFGGWVLDYKTSIPESECLGLCF